MNVLLWRAEYGSRDSGVPVPLDLVCRKILTAPDASSLSVYQAGRKIGFCEFSTSIQQEMAELDENNPPPEGLVGRAGCQFRLNGNVAAGDFTNRVKFDGRLKFSPGREWRELNLKFFHAFRGSRNSRAGHQPDGVRANHNRRRDRFPRVHLRGTAKSRHIAARARRRPGRRVWKQSGFVRAAGRHAIAQNIPWDASRVRLMAGREAVSAYRLETRVLGQQIVIHVSTVGEILRVELPGGVTATLDDWSKL